MFDDVGETVGMIQNPPPDYLLRFILTKVASLPHDHLRDDPEGRSILRPCYIDYYMVRNFRAIEGIGVERDLAGMPTPTAPEGVDLWNAADPAFAPM